MRFPPYAAMPIAVRVIYKYRSNATTPSWIAAPCWESPATVSASSPAHEGTSPGVSPSEARYASYQHTRRINHSYSYNGS